MTEPYRKISNTKPVTKYNLGNGYWYYNYDIKEEIVEVPSMEETSDGPKEELRYTYLSITTEGKPTYKKCVELIIRQYISLTQEFDLINSANKDILQGIKDSTNISKYKDYLNKVEEIKANVAKDFNKK